MSRSARSSCRTLMLPCGQHHRCLEISQPFRWTFSLSKLHAAQAHRIRLPHLDAALQQSTDMLQAPIDSTGAVPRRWPGVDAMARCSSLLSCCSNAAT